MSPNPEESEPAPPSQEDRVSPAQSTSQEGSDRENAKATSVASVADQPLPECIQINEFQKKSHLELMSLANDLNARVTGTGSRRQLVMDLLSWYGRRGVRIEGEGIFELLPDGVGHLHWTHENLRPGEDDIFVPNALSRRAQIRPAQKVRVSVKAPRDRERFAAADEILAIEGIPTSEWVAPKTFDSLTPLFPKDRLLLEVPGGAEVSCRLVDLIAPLGKGQRGLIVAPPRSGKTILLKNLARSIATNHPEVELLILLVDERPEEVTDFEESVPAHVFSSTFDESPKRHIQLAELVTERAKRLVEQKKDVVVMLDSLTRLARAYNNLQGGKGALGSGGMDARALQKVRKFFGAARNVEEGGSLTILATALVETESRMDSVIFEEFKGTGNMEVCLDREMAERRIFPAIHPQKSGTRNDNLLYHPDEFKRIAVIRRQMASMPAMEAIETLIKNLHASRTNAELLLSGLR